MRTDALAEIGSFIILGAAGDLPSRYLLPALAELHEAKKLPDRLAIVGVGRDNWDNEAFRRHVMERFESNAVESASRSHAAFISRLEYRRADVAKSGQVASALEPVLSPVLAYLALPPSVFAPAIEALSSMGLPKGSRIIIEKPFGENLTSAQNLNRLLHQSFPEQAIFRMDHFLGKQTVQNALGLRFANRVFESLWTRAHVQRVELIWEETLGLEGRASYYDSAGALRDMIQNHLLQLLCLVAMEAPLALNERDLRDRKADVLRAVRRLSRAEVERQTLRARYSAGRIGDHEIPAYVDEAGVDPQRSTETFAQVTLMIDNWRWAGVPFVLRTGKALAKERREIAVHFQPVPYLAFGQDSEPIPNVLRLQLDPDRVSLGTNINGPGDPFTLEHIVLDAELAPQDLPAYGRLLLDALEGDPVFSIRADEAEASWRIVEPILEAWAAGRIPLLEYPAGSEGPSETIPLSRARTRQ